MAKWVKVTFINIEHAFSKCSQDPTILLVSLIGYILILTTNISLIKFILNQATKTFLDWLVMFDCILSAANILSIITVGVVGPANVQMFGDCYFPVLSVLFINICKRYLSLGLFCEIHVHQHVSMSNL